MPFLVYSVSRPKFSDFLMVPISKEPLRRKLQILAILAQILYKIGSFSSKQASLGDLEQVLITLKTTAKFLSQFCSRWAIKRLDSLLNSKNGLLLQIGTF